MMHSKGKMNADEFLGEEIITKYNEIYPILRLILYRIDTVGRNGFNGYDGRNPDDKIGLLRNIDKFTGKINYLFSCRINRKYLEGSQPVILLSETAFRIGRYKEMLDEVLDCGSVYRLCSESNCTLSSILRESKLKKSRYPIVSISMGESVAGIRLKRSAYSVFDCFVKLLNEGKTCLECIEEVQKLLDALLDAVTERISFLCNVIRDNKIQIFVTFNPYHLSDYIVMMSCKKMNVSRVVYFHYGLAHAPMWSEEQLKAHYTGMKLIQDGMTWDLYDVLYFWSQADLEWWKKHGKSKNWYGESVGLKVMGCPEVTKEMVNYYRKKYPRKNLITISAPMCDMFSDVFDSARGIKPTESDLKELVEWKKHIYYEFYLMAKKNHVDVCVRYHPSEPVFSRKLDKEIFEKYGFAVSEDSREGLYKSVCESIATFGHTTSFSVVSSVFGAKTVLLNLDNSEYDLCGLPMDLITLEEVAEYVIDKNMDETCMEECFDVERFMKSVKESREKQYCTTYKK